MAKSTSKNLKSAGSNKHTPKPAKPTKPASSAKDAKPIKPDKLAKPAAKPKAAATLVKKKPAPVAAKSDKPQSIRKTRGKEIAKPTAKTAVPAVKPKVAATPAKQSAPAAPVKWSVSFLNLQRQRLLQLKDNMVDSMSGVAAETLRSRAQDSEASAFGMHQADAGSDAYDRDFALNLLSQEQDALYEIEEALKRIDFGTYGVCEMSGRAIPQARLEAIPYARFTVEAQSQVEKEYGSISPRRAIRSLFGLGTDDDEEESDEDSLEEKEN